MRFYATEVKLVMDDLQSLAHHGKVGIWPNIMWKFWRNTGTV